MDFWHRFFVSLDNDYLFTISIYVLSFTFTVQAAKYKYSKNYFQWSLKLSVFKAAFNSPLIDFPHNSTRFASVDRSNGVYIKYKISQIGNLKIFNRAFIHISAHRTDNFLLLCYWKNQIIFFSMLPWNLRTFFCEKLYKGRYFDFKNT